MRSPSRVACSATSATQLVFRDWNSRFPKDKQNKSFSLKDLTTPDRINQMQPVQVDEGTLNSQHDPFLQNYLWDVPGAKFDIGSLSLKHWREYTLDSDA
jgi:hypothetical protein